MRDARTILLVILLVGALAAGPAAPTFAQAGQICDASAVDDAAEGGELDIVRYAGGYRCADNALVFTFLTADSWTPDRFNEAFVRIDVDGDVTNGCGEGDYLAYAVNDDGRLLGGVFASPSCDALTTLGLVTVQTTPTTLTLTVGRELIGDPGLIGHYGSLSNPGETNSTADYAPGGTDRLSLAMSALSDPASAPVCIPDPTGDVVLRDPDGGGDQPADRPAVDVTLACAHYGDGIGLDVWLERVDFGALGPGSGPSALVYADDDDVADLLLRAIWDGLAFTVEVTDTAGAVVCTGRAQIRGQVLQVGDLPGDCFGDAPEVRIGVGMGARADGGRIHLDRVGPASTLTTLRRAAEPDPTATGTDPADIDVADPADAPVITTVRRLAGPARIETSVEVSRAAWPDGAAAVVLARQDVEADALAGSALAAAVQGPLLLTPSGGLTVATATELRRVLPPGARVYVLGGMAALSDRVVADVQQFGFGTVRLAGPSRVETGLAIAEETAAVLGTVEHVLVADAFEFQWSLIAGAAAGANGGVVLPTAPSGLRDDAQAFLDAHPGAEVTAVGPGAVQAAPDARAIDGGDPYYTSVLLAEAFFPDAPQVAVASGEAFPDGLAGGAFAGSVGMPLLLSAADGLPDVVGDHLSGSDAGGAWILGGEAALSAAVEQALRQAVG